jgi:ArsR family transcriptional regulator, arsenate/arsenite/antimonite-responsive transcriptional repressor
MSRRIYETGPRLEVLFRALADRTRLRLLNLMRDQELCVCYFVQILQTTQPKISRHLAYLRRAGIVAARRQGTWMHYRILVPQDRRAAGILKEVLASLCDDREMQRDLTRLNTACCAPQNFVNLMDAPPPVKISEPLHTGQTAHE